MLLSDIGMALYGAQWQTDMAQALAVSARQVRRWVAGTTPVPAGIYVDLMRIMLEHQAALDDLIERARQHGV